MDELLRGTYKVNKQITDDVESKKNVLLWFIRNPKKQGVVYNW
jgi:hypothetical protein